MEWGALRAVGRETDRNTQSRRVVVERDGRVVNRRDRVHHRKSETGSARAAAAVAAIEPLEHAAPLLRRYARAVIGNVKPRLRLFGGNGDGNGTARGSVDHGVCNQVRGHLGPEASRRR